MGVLLFAVLCVLLAYMLIAKKFTKRLIITASIIIMTGLTLYVSSVGLGWTTVQQVRQQYQKAEVSYEIDASEISGSRALKLDGYDDSVEVEYVVSNEKPRASVKYSTLMFRHPTVQLKRDNNTLSLSANINKDSSYCGDFQYCKNIQVTIYGPALQKIDTNRNVNYTTTEQDELNLNSHDAHVNIISSRTIGKLNANLERAELFASQAAVRDVELVSDASSTTNLAKIQQLNVTAPTICTVDDRALVSYHNATQITLNQKIIQNTDAEYPCVRFSVAE